MSHEISTYHPIAEFQGNENWSSRVIHGGPDLSLILQDGTGAVTRLLHAKIREQVAVTDFGAVGDGIADDSDAVEAALASYRRVYFPAGTYRVTRELVFTDTVSLEVYGAGGLSSTILKDFEDDSLIHFVGGQRIGVSGLVFDGAGTTAGAGLKFSGGAGVNKVRDNNFRNFPGPGLLLAYTALLSASGVEVHGNVFLGNGFGTPRTAQLYAAYCNDSWFSKNQFGVFSLEADKASHGSYLYECKAGNYSENFHWENTIGCLLDACHYSRVFANRFEENQQEGLQLVNTYYLTFTGNTIHTNSKSADNTYDGVFVGACSQFTLTGNTSFTWTAGLNTRYALNIDDDCTDGTVHGNAFFGGQTGSINYPIGVASLIFGGNLPA
jgi:hypothetical protein